MSRGLFFFGRKKTKARRRPTAKQREETAEARRMTLMAEGFTKLVDGSPEAMRAAIAKHYNVDIPAPDPMAEAKAQSAIEKTKAEIERDKKKVEVEKMVTEAAMKKIEADPALLERFATIEMEKLTGQGQEGYGELGEDGGYEGRGGGIREFLDELDMYEEVKTKLGGGGGWTSLLSPAFGIELLQTLRAFAIGRGNVGTGGGEATVLVQLDGKMVRITESEYNRLRAEGRLGPAAAIAPAAQPAIAESTTPPPDVVLEEEVTPEPVVESSDLGPKEHIVTIEQLDAQLVAFMWMLDLTPEEFVLQLKQDVQIENPYAPGLWAWLRVSDYSQVVSMAERFKGNMSLSAYAERLVSDEGREWAEAVLSLVKSESQD